MRGETAPRVAYFGECTGMHDQNNTAGQLVYIDVKPLNALFRQPGLACQLRVTIIVKYG